MKNTSYICPIHLTKVTCFTKCQVEDLVKWPWFNQIGHIEWIRFIEINRPNLTLNQIDHDDLTFSQMNHIHLII
jgi:hypothetical protein